MKVMNLKTRRVTNVPDPPELVQWREDVKDATLTPAPKAVAAVEFTPVESSYFKAEFGMKNSSVILHVTPEEGVVVSEKALGGALQQAFDRETFAGEYVEEVKSWAIRIDNPPDDYDGRIMLTLQLLEDRIAV